MTSILAKLKLLKPPEPTTQPIDNNYMRPTVLECNLVRLGCGQDVIEDALHEPPERWEGIINYYEKNQ